MNTPHGILPPRRGFALVTVLFIVVLLTILVIGMFLMGESRTRSSALRIASLDTRIASETALNLAQTQIRDATSRGINSNGLATETWASQPGAIRTYDDAGNPTAIYKLYSSDTMVITNDTFTGNSDVPTGWETQPDSFTDINEPVNRPNPDTGDDNWIYPIVSPESIGNVVGFDATGPQNPDTLWDDSTAMPVRWLYLSADGSISTDPLANDPVARVAFWTDDESCKINVNTASATDQNSYWDMPRAIARYDVRELAFKQPAQYEYNRYPGHPATVSLSAVFPDKNNQGNAWLETLINTTPRYSWGGSKNATVTIASGSRQPIPRTKPDRLYATMDEYLYRPDRSVQLGLTEDELEQTRFFLTASSRSSELNLFGQPRVTIWPVHEETGDNYRTPFDQLIAFCSTIGAPGDERQYIFQRKDALSQTNDWNITRNQELVEYLRRLTSRDIPGFGGISAPNMMLRVGVLEVSATRYSLRFSITSAAPISMRLTAVCRIILKDSPRFFATLMEAPMCLTAWAQPLINTQEQAMCFPLIPPWDAVPDECRSFQKWDCGSFRPKCIQLRRLTLPRRLIPLRTSNPHSSSKQTPPCRGTSLGFHSASSLMSDLSPENRFPRSTESISRRE